MSIQNKSIIFALCCMIIYVCNSSFIFSIHINEIMYNPMGSDNNKEFVEFYLDYNDNAEEFADYTISDSESADDLVLMKKGDNGFVLVVEEGYDVGMIGECNATIFSSGSTIGNSLNNENDCIYLYDNSSDLLDYYCYDGSMGNDDDNSIEFYDGSWYESFLLGGSPGCDNTIVGYLENGKNINGSNSTSANEEELEDDTGESEDIASSIQILEVYSDSGEVDFDKMLKIKLYLARGDTRKTVVYVYMFDEGEDKKVSEEQRIYLLDKFTEFETIIYLPLKKYSCSKESFYPKDLVLRIEGLGAYDSYGLDDLEFRDYCKEKSVAEKISVKSVGNYEISYLEEDMVEESWGRINSFYTRAKKYNENIRLFSNIEFNRKGIYDISISNNGESCYVEEFEIDDKIKDTFDFYCDVVFEDNNYTIDVGLVNSTNILSRSFSKVFDVSDVKIQEKDELEKNSTIIFEISELSSYSNKDEMRGGNDVTGHFLEEKFNDSVVYEKRENEANSTLFLLVVIMIVFLSVGFVIKKFWLK